MTNQTPNLEDEETANEMLATAIDFLATTRARQYVAISVENSIGAAYHAETAAKAKASIKDILDMKDRTLVTALVKSQTANNQPNTPKGGGRIVW